MEQEEVDRVAKFNVGDGVLVMEATPVLWKVIRRYWQDGPGIVYDLQGNMSVHIAAWEKLLTKAEEGRVF